ncbi:hypothetical protein F2Q70_00021559 [Brassica cretica]|uniref:Uncharacterized protein n=1 Tax=Brassica cretica TaxID=69181 RepID=A0A8S9M918_BRACR|nr:hypothetical protein F2Q70_00021559 [Brassica cretica]KAF2616524.1 hypothetical protein F2Q68_00040018 [Brassica cretica]
MDLGRTRGSTFETVRSLRSDLIRAGSVATFDGSTEISARFYRKLAPQPVRIVDCDEILVCGLVIWGKIGVFGRSLYPRICGQIVTLMPIRREKKTLKRGTSRGSSSEGVHDDSILVPKAEIVPHSMDPADAFGQKRRAEQKSFEFLIEGKVLIIPWRVTLPATDRVAWSVAT